MFGVFLVIAPLLGAPWSETAESSELQQADSESLKAAMPLGSLRISGFAYWLQPEQLWKKERLLGDSSPNDWRSWEQERRSGFVCVWVGWCGRPELNRWIGCCVCVCVGPLVRAPESEPWSVLV